MNQLGSRVHCDDMTHVKVICQTHGYELKESIGEGGYGTVYLVRSQRYQEDFVVKRIPVEVPDKITSEVEVLMSLHHPNIINMYDYWFDDEALYVILEYCPNGSLKDYLKKHGPLTVDHLFQSCKEIASAIEFCHANNIVHRDIKPANILIDKYNRVKLADFGLSVQATSRINPQIGSPAYMSPEALNGKKYINHFKNDIWALGVTLFELCSGSVPWSARTITAMIQEVNGGLVIRPEGMEYSFWKMLRGMMDLDPRNRITIDEVLKSEYFTSKEARHMDNGRKPHGEKPGRGGLPTTSMKSMSMVWSNAGCVLHDGHVLATENKALSTVMSFALPRRGTLAPFRSRNLRIVEPKLCSRSQVSFDCCPKYVPA